MDDKLTKAVRTVSMQVATVDGDWRETTGRWHTTSDQCRQVANCFMQTWELWHVQNGSGDKLREWLDKRRDEGIKAAGKCPIEAIPKKLSKLIYHTLTRRFPNLHTRVVTLLQNTIGSDLKKHKASKGNLPGHSAVLLFHQSRPSFTGSYPIPFDKANCVIEPPDKPRGNFRLILKTWRLPQDKGNAVAVADRLGLRCQGRKVQSQVAILRRIASGECAFRGSTLIYSEKKRKWFAQICYRMPALAKPELDDSKTAVLYPRKKWPWTLLLPSRRKRPGGTGHFIGVVRRQLLMQRWNRRGNYRLAGSANKGHGRERAGAGPQWKLQQRWKDLTKRVNHGVTTDVVQWCIAKGIGRLVYVQPEGTFAETRFLHNAGKVHGRRDSTGWPWFQVLTQLRYKCQQNGIELVERKRPKSKNTKDDKPQLDAAQEVAVVSGGRGT